MSVALLLVAAVVVTEGEEKLGMLVVMDVVGFDSSCEIGEFSRFAEKW